MATTKSEIPTALVVNAETGEITTRPLETSELEQIAISVAEVANYEAAIEAKAAARQSALAKLAELGLTEEEIAAL